MLYKKILKRYGVKEDEQAFLLGKFQNYYKVCSLWIDLLSEREEFIRYYLEEHNIENIAIYGFADIGRKLYRQLKKENVNVLYAIDQYVGSGIEGVKVYRVEEDIPNVDAIIITAYDSYEIKKIMSKKNSTPMYSILELLEAIKESINSNDD